MAKEIINSFHLQVAMRTAIDKAVAYRNPYFTPEHLICAIMVLNPVREALESLGISVKKIVGTLDDYIKHLDKIPDDKMHSIDPSLQFQEMIMGAIDIMHASSAPELEVTHIIQAAMNLQDSLAGNILNYYAEKDSEFLTTIIWQVERYAKEFPIKGADMSGSGGLLIEEKGNKKDVFLARDWGYDHPEDEMLYSNYYRDSMGEDERERDVEETFPFVTCINDHLKEHNPLIGRETELERTIHVLCRKDKNNPLHVGEPGVGKTALIYGLAQRIEDGNVPDMLRGAKIYQIDMAAMVAGTQYRGDFEKRVKQTMDYLSRLDNAIVYIDEIHSIVGTGATGESAMDASNMLKPYLEGGKLRFIGSTTYEEFNRQLSRNKGIVRRFQQIDILEPTVDETIEIINGLKERYESFHKVKYVPAAIDYAVRASDKHIMGRFLPDKAIDLIDEAGAYRHIHPTNKKRQMVDKALIDDVLKKVMKINATALKEDNNAQLKSLEKRIKARIYGQDQAVTEVVQAVQMSKAGLIDDGKPLASLLFVGPTGVGKTEVARVLAQELGVDLVRFDMSEYTEKHTVAKLIGSPAGYVGYEDGGLLTDAIRKTPNCVLLLDEIEKAHEDIYNILLQVMDYARLTDNKGRHADFRNVVLIMTSNAGAQHAGQSVGFDSRGSRGGDMLKQVKKTFKPEFINRLSGTIVFNDMDETMASMILDKRLRELQEKLNAKKVTLVVENDARAFLLKEGFTAEYGARELDRVLHRELKTKLVRQILFGKLKRGGTARVSLHDGKIIL
ncbi:MAG: AAA family ATPase [Muribaculaceae bacterium]|nr:AAA family ATPase [Muribaculaceae bacterium]